MTIVKFWLLSILSGLIFAMAWPAIGSQTYLIFLAWMPLFFLEKELSAHASRWKGIWVFGYSYLTFFIFNLVTTYWIYYASDWGMLAAVLCNSFFMSVVFWLFHFTKRWVGEKQGYLGFIILWVAFEYLHLNWELSWTWLTLGNVFANLPQGVQWYEYTGVLGGSVLIIAINLLFFSTLRRFLANQPGKWKPAILAFTILLTLGSWSYSTYSNYEEHGKAIHVVAIQPNIDPYFEKFHGMAESDQLDRMIEQSLEMVNEKTGLVLWPETAFPTPCWEHEFEYLYGTEEIRKLIQRFPNMRLITGLLSTRLYLDSLELSATSRKFRDGLGWYDNYNSAIEVDAGSTIELHHKSKLVLGVEKVPFLSYFPIMKRLSINLGGSAGGYGQDGHPTVFFNPEGKEGVGPIICYESVYGEYVTEYVRKGAELLAIITNDGWWDDTPGYKQHLAYARLRAIENRRSIGRSANTGISAFINQRGDVVAPTTWWVQAVTSADLKLNNELTFYTKYGDVIGRIMAFLAPLLLLLAFVKSRNKTEQRLNR